MAMTRTLSWESGPEVEHVSEIMSNNALENRLNEAYFSWSTLN